MKKITQKIWTLLVVVLILSSCSKQENIQLPDADFDYLKNYVDELDNVTESFLNIEGEFGTEIFGDNSAAVCGYDPNDLIGPQIRNIDRIVELLGYSNIEELHNWMVAAGKKLYDIHR